MIKVFAVIGGIIVGLIVERMIPIKHDGNPTEMIGSFVAVLIAFTISTFTLEHLAVLFKSEAGTHHTPVAQAVKIAAFVTLGGIAMWVACIVVFRTVPDRSYDGRPPAMIDPK